MKYDVNVTRVGYSSRTIQVSAESMEEAGKKALEVAGDFEFSEHDADYAVEGLAAVEETTEESVSGPAI